MVSSMESAERVDLKIQSKESRVGLTDGLPQRTSFSYLLVIIEM